MGCDILIVHPTGGWGGAERTTVNIVRALMGERRVCVCSNDRRFLDVLPGSSLFVPFSPWFEGWREIPSDVFRLARLVRSIRPRLLLGMMPYGAFLGSAVKRLPGPRFTFMASPRGSCLNFLRHFTPTRRERVRYRLFF